MVFGCFRNSNKGYYHKPSGVTVNLQHFIKLKTEHMHGTDAVAITRKIQRGQAAGVVIDCPGGTVSSFMHSALALADQRFTALGLSLGSLGVDYYLCAGTRLALPSSTFGLHHPYLAGCNDDDEGETLNQLLCQYEINRALLETSRPTDSQRKAQAHLIELIDMIAECQHFGVRWFAKRTGLEPGIVNQMMHDEVTLTASEALQLGLVHRIIEA